MKIGKKTLEAIPEELRAKAQACETAEELDDLLKAEGIEIADELIGGVAGGWYVPIGTVPK